MAVLLLAEVTGGALALDATAKALTAAKAMGDVTVLVAGPKAAADEAATLNGVAKVLVADDAAYANALAEPVADLVISLAGDYEHIVAPATSSAKNVLPRVAALLDVMVISDISAVEAPDTFERPVYAGNAMQVVKSTDATKVVSVRTSTSRPPPPAGRPRSRPPPPPAMRASPNGSRTTSMLPTGPSSPPPALSSRAAVAWGRKRISL